MFRKRNSFKSSKKPAPRRSSSLSTLNSLDETVYSQSDMQIDYDGEIKLALGTHELVFRGGEWLGENEGAATKTGVTTADAATGPGRAGSISSQAYGRLQKQNEQLQEENNLLKFKFEALLDIIALYIADDMAEKEKSAMADKTAKEKREGATESMTTERREGTEEENATKDKRGGAAENMVREMKESMAAVTTKEKPPNEYDVIS